MEALVAELQMQNDTSAETLATIAGVITDGDGINASLSQEIQRTETACQQHGTAAQVLRQKILDTDRQVCVFKGP